MFTEKDILEFLDGTFTGDKEGIRFYIEQNPEVKKKFGFYNSLFSLLKEDDPAVITQFNLGDTVIKQIRKEQDLKYTRETNFIKAGIAVIALIVIYVVFEQFTFNVAQVFESILIAVTLLVTGLILVFTKVEMDARKKIFSSFI